MKSSSEYSRVECLRRCVLGHRFDPRRARVIALTLTIGAAGGALFDQLQIPLAWMLGSLSATMIAAMSGVPVAVPASLRTATLIIIGLFIGSSFNPSISEYLHRWPVTMVLSVVLVIALSALAAWYLHRVARLDWATALFAAPPGGLSTMVVLGTVAGGDERTIALVQTIRVVVVVFLVPWIVRWQDPHSGVLPEPTHTLDGTDVLWLIGGATLGYGIARVIRLPAAPMTGSMLGAAALYMGGWVDGRLPNALIFAALWILGASIGCRFAATRIRQLLGIGRAALVSVGAMLAVSTLFAGAVSAAMDLRFLAVLLAFAPGGMAEMSLIAISFDIDPMFVAAHHLIRVMIILIAFPFLSARLLRHV